MKELNNLIKKVVLGSLASLVGQAQHASGYTLEPTEEPKVSTDNVMTFPKPLLTPKLLLKLNSDNTWDLKSHRSHRSHSSHRSHYSSTSGSSGGASSSGSSGGSTSSGGTRTVPSGTSSGQPKTSESLGLTKATKNVYATLGSRILKKGMTGFDVTELANILLKKKYLQMNDGSTTITGELTFDSTIEEVVKEFQKDKKLPVTGIVDITTAYTLKTK